MSSWPDLVPGEESGVSGVRLEQSSVLAIWGVTWSNAIYYLSFFFLGFLHSCDSGHVNLLDFLKLEFISTIHRVILCFPTQMITY